MKNNILLFTIGIAMIILSLWGGSWAYGLVQDGDWKEIPITGTTWIIYLTGAVICFRVMIR